MKANESQADALRMQIRDLKARMPAHSVKPVMLQELEELEERLTALLLEKQNPS